MQVLTFSLFGAIIKNTGILHLEVMLLNLNQSTVMNRCVNWRILAWQRIKLQTVTEFQHGYCMLQYDCCWRNCRTNNLCVKQNNAIAKQNELALRLVELKAEFPAHKQIQCPAPTFSNQSAFLKIGCNPKSAYNDSPSYIFLQISGFLCFWQIESHKSGLCWPVSKLLTIYKDQLTLLIK